MDTLVPVGDTTLELVDLQSRMGEEPKCASALGCDKNAEWSCVMRCCGESSLLCGECVNIARSNVDGFNIRCLACRHNFGITRFELVVRTIPL